MRIDFERNKIIFLWNTLCKTNIVQAIARVGSGVHYSVILPCLLEQPAGSILNEPVKYITELKVTIVSLQPIERIN